MRLIDSKARLRASTRVLGWRRLCVTLVASVVLGALLSLSSEMAAVVVILRAVLVGLCAMLAFGFFERRPERLPR